MANLKEVRNRISSVNSTQQITKAMKMVSAAKLRKAQDAILQLRPYAEKLEEVLANVSATLDESSNNVYGTKRESTNRVLLVVVSSDRGLCGAFNSNIVKATEAHINENYASQYAKGKVDILCIGKKAQESLKRKGYNTIDSYVDIFTRLSFDAVKEAAEFAMSEFVNEYYDKVEVVYNEFKNAAIQLIRVNQVLPIEETEQEEVVATGADVDYIFEPNKEFIIEELIPKSIKLQIYKAVLDSNASEHGARMTAMDKATDNAGELLKQLKLTYNRARQAAITTEILEIVGGAEALAQGS